MRYVDREGQIQEVDWVAAFPGYYTPFIPLFKRETQQQNGILRGLDALIEEGRYVQVYCGDGAVVLRRVSGKAQGQSSSSDKSNSCLVPD